MKKLFRTMIAAILCAAIAIASIGTDTAYAAGKVPLKVTFNKKSVTLSKDINESIKKVSLKILKKKWGKPKKKTNDGYTTYTWKKGKTSIRYSAGKFSDIDINIEDRNGEMFGLKIGMTKDAALKRTEKLGINRAKDLTEEILKKSAY